MRLFLFFVIMIHGLIHLIGFVKAFKLAEVNQLTQNISPPVGLLWLLSTLFFIVTAILFLLKNEYWWWVAAPALLISQTVIILSWNDAKFGTVANLIILLPFIVSLMNVQPSSFGNIYKAEVQKGLNRLADMPLETEADLEPLPAPVQKYLHYVGAVGKPKIQNFRAKSAGSMKTKMDGDWLDITSRQYNFFDDPTRVFFIESTMFGVPFDGLHLYVGPNATMQIKVASLFQVVDAKGPEMNQSETVTLFNDMCLFAPATLIDKNIQWEAIDALTVKAKFTNKGNTIVAWLYFNEKGELINFISDDRYQSADGKTYKNYRWSTPVKDYRDFGGRKVATYGEAIWHTPEGEFPYAKFNLVEIEYNRKEYK